MSLDSFILNLINMRISVIIVTRNRMEDIRISINGYLKQQYTDKEIIVIDNASDDGTREMMLNEFPDIKYRWLPDNFDIRAINLGIEMSTGDIIWRTDSDSHPEKPDAFEKAVTIFNKHQDIHIISTENIEVRQNYTPWDWYPFAVDKVNVPEKGYKANFFPGTGAAIRRVVYDKIGGFWEFGFEELDFCTRAIAAGFSVRYFPNIRTLHYASMRDRIYPDRWVQSSKQMIRYNWRYFPFFMAAGRTSQIFCFQLLIALLTRLPLIAIIEGAFSMLAVGLKTIRTERNIIPKEKIADVTLGVTVFRTQIRFFKQIIKNKMQKCRKK